MKNTWSEEFNVQLTTSDIWVLVTTGVITYKYGVLELEMLQIPQPEDVDHMPIIVKLIFEEYSSSLWILPFPEIKYAIDPDNYEENRKLNMSVNIFKNLHERTRFSIYARPILPVTFASTVAGVFKQKAFSH